MFEVEDLVVASPATVSRVGIIYMEPRGLGLDVLVQSWLQVLPGNVSGLIQPKLSYLFDIYLHPSIAFLRSNPALKELVPTVDNNLTESLLRILDCHLEVFRQADASDSTGLSISLLATSAIFNISIKLS